VTDKRAITDAELALAAALNGIEAALELIRVLSDRAGIVPENDLHFVERLKVIADSADMAKAVRAQLRSERGA
jgi:hypothetical protein